jgi:hypothetical protein
MFDFGCNLFLFNKVAPAFPIMGGGTDLERLSLPLR